MSSSCLESMATPLSSEQLCYIPCKFCTIVLAVSVPCSSLFDIVSVRCGHCNNMWSVDMASTTFNSLSSVAPAAVTWQQPPPSPPQQTDFFQQVPNYNNMGDYRIDNTGSSSNKYNYNKTALFRPLSITTPGKKFTEERVVNRPPEKRQRVPSAYNQFIKEEIQRIKANNPDITHREAFSTAAKNWAHFPHIHFGLMLDTNNQAKGSQKHVMPRTALLN